MRILNKSSNGVSGDQEESASIVHAAGLIVTVSLILLFGLTMLYSTSSNIAGSSFFVKQLFWAVLGLAAALTVFVIGYRKLLDCSLALIGLSIILLIAADFFFPAVNGAHRWIPIPKVGNIQPSELAKIAICLFLAKFCSEKMRYINEIFSFKKGVVIPACMVCGPVLALVLLGKDLGTTCLLFAVMMLIFFAAGLQLRWSVLPFAVLPPLGLWIIKHFDPERWSRLTSFLNPELCEKTDGYQLWLSILALGSGGTYGVGFTESRLKASYLPENHTDFILAIVGEEMGYIGLCAVLVAYAAFIFFAIQISINARTKQGMLLGFGLSSTLMLQAIINIGVVSGALPTKGMPAPFISYGGSNLIICLTAVGFLLSIAAESASPGLNEFIWDLAKSKLQYLNPARLFASPK
ncbi:MAG: hypothetical protein A2X49_12090 [Lentisphaerae bacterium GWF2_52_8]|nr:MAG: hypothetical protein A2X49_12090 [Lentisphaerae bacterium GWF2_52_8]